MNNDIPIQVQPLPEQQRSDGPLYDEAKYRRFKNKLRIVCRKFNLSDATQDSLRRMYRARLKPTDPNLVKVWEFLTT